MVKFKENTKIWIKENWGLFIILIITILCFLALIIWNFFNKPPKPINKNCKPQQNFVSNILIGTANSVPANLNSCPDGYTPVNISGIAGSQNNVNYSTISNSPFTQLCVQKIDTVCDDTVLVGDIKAVKLAGDFPIDPSKICSKDVIGEDGYFPAINYFPDNIDPSRNIWGQFVHSQGCNNVAICVKSGTRDSISPMSNINVNVSSDSTKPCPSGYINGGQSIVQGDSNCLKNPSNYWNFCYTK
jgi:hypothetical protein